MRRSKFDLIIVATLELLIIIILWCKLNHPITVTSKQYMNSHFPIVNKEKGSIGTPINVSYLEMVRKNRGRNEVNVGWNYNQL